MVLRADRPEPVVKLESKLQLRNLLSDYNNVYCTVDTIAMEVNAGSRDAFCLRSKCQCGKPQGLVGR